MNQSARQQILAITGALSDNSRLRILASLRGGELCVCHVIALLGLAPSTVSKHLLVLRQAGLVESRKEGRWMHYQLTPSLTLAARAALAFVFDSLKGDDTVASDAQRLKAIMRIDPEVLCQGRREGVPCCLSAAGRRRKARRRAHSVRRTKLGAAVSNWR